MVLHFIEDIQQCGSHFIQAKETNYVNECTLLYMKHTLQEVVVFFCCHVKDTEMWECGEY